MDPLSIAASAAGLIGITLTLIQTLNKVSSAISKRSQLLKEVLDDLNLLRTVLDDLSKPNDGKPTSDTAALIAVFDGCKSVMLQIDKELDALLTALKGGTRSRTLAKLTLSSKMESIASLRNQLDKYKSTLVIALSLRTMKIASSDGLKDMVEDLRNDLAVSSRSNGRRGAEWQNPIQQYLSASLGVPPPKARIQSPISTSRSISGASSTTLVSMGTSKPSRDSSSISSAKVSSSGPKDADFGSLDDWLSAFSPQEDKAEDRGPTKQGSTSNNVLITKSGQPSSTAWHHESDVIHFRICESYEHSSTPRIEEISVRKTDTVASICDELHKKGYERVFGFYCGKDYINPFRSHDDPVPVESVEGKSCYSMQKGLKISINESLETFYDNFIRATALNEADNISLKMSDDSITFMNGDITIDISFARTLRVPEDSKVYGAPVLFAPMPLFLVGNHESELPVEIMRKGGIMLPLYQREALALNIKMAKSHQNIETEFAMKCLAGTVNVVSGNFGQNKNNGNVQEHVVIPKQSRLDGFVYQESLVKQFIAMALGSGYTAEGQLTGKEKFGGLQLLVAPKFKGHLDRPPIPATSKPRKPGLLIRLNGGEFIKQSVKLRESQDLFTPPVTRSSHKVKVDNSIFGVPQGFRQTLVHEAMLELGKSQVKHIELEPIYAFDVRLELDAATWYKPVAALDPDKYHPVQWDTAQRTRASFNMEVAPFTSLTEIYNIVKQHLQVQIVVLFYYEAQLKEDGKPFIHYSLPQSCRLSAQIYTTRIRPNYFGSLSPPTSGFSYGSPDQYIQPNSYPSTSQTHDQQTAEPPVERKWYIPPQTLEGNENPPVEQHSRYKTSIPEPLILAERKKYKFESDSEEADIEDDELLENLDVLTGAAKRLNALAQATGQEVEAQNKMLESIAEKSGKVDDSIDLRPNEHQRQSLSSRRAPNHAEKKTATQRWDMGLGAGGLIRQGIVKDPCPGQWNWGRACFINIQFVNSLIFERLTGAPPPPCPVTFKDYVAAGLPFYHLVQPNVVDGSKILATLKSVGDLDVKKQIETSSRIRTDSVPTGCILCEQNLTDTILRPCNHIFCGACIRDLMTIGGEFQACGACGRKINDTIGFAGPMEIPKVQKLPDIESPREKKEIGTFGLTDLSSDDQLRKITDDDTSERKVFDARPKSTSLPSLVGKSVGPAAGKPLPPEISIIKNDRVVSNIVEAVQQEDLERLQDFLDDGQDPNADHLVQLAVELGHCNVLLMLSEYGADMNAVNEDTAYRPIHQAVRSGKLAALLLLLRLGVDIETLTSHTDACEQLTPVQLAAMFGQLRSLKLLLRKGASLHATDIPQHDCVFPKDMLSLDARVLAVSEVIPCHARSALHLAAAYGHVEVVAFLLDQGLDVDHCDQPNGTTPLLYASLNGHFRVIKLLVEAGADVESELLGHTTLSFLLSRSWPEIYVYETVKALLDAGAASGTRGSSGTTLMHMAASSGRTDILSLLVKRGDDVNILSQGVVVTNPLSFAFAGCHLTCCDALMSYGATFDSVVVERLWRTLQSEESPDGFTAVLKVSENWKDAAYRTAAIYSFVQLLENYMTVVVDVEALFRTLASMEQANLIYDIMEYYTKKDSKHQTSRDIHNVSVVDLIYQASLHSGNALAVRQLLAKVKSDIEPLEWVNFYHTKLVDAVRMATLRNDHKMTESILSSLHANAARRCMNELRSPLSPSLPQNAAMQALLKSRADRLRRIR